MKYYITEKSQFKSIANSADEQETTINISRGEDKATIWTNDNTMITKLSKLVDKNPDIWKCYVVGNINKPTGYFFETTKKCISFREGTYKSNNGRIKKSLTEEHKQKLIAGLKKFQSNK